MSDLAIAVMAASATRIRAHARSVTRVMVALALVAGVGIGWYAHGTRAPATACALTRTADDVGWFDGTHTHDYMRMCDPIPHAQ